jgi:serpin B
MRRQVSSRAGVPAAAAGKARRRTSPVRRAGAAALAATVLCGVATIAKADPAPPGEAAPVLGAFLTPAQPVGTPQEQVVAGMNAFATDLYRVAAKPGENAVFSPLSIAYAFAMLRAGARGETAAQLDETFGFPATGMHDAYGGLSQGLVTTKAAPKAQAAKSEKAKAPTKGTYTPWRPKPPTFNLANGLWTIAGYPVEAEFRETLSRHYGAEAQGLDMSDPAAAVKRVNDWISEHTAGRVSKVLDRLHPTTRLVLANAVYLKADWTAKFTRPLDEDFRIGGKTVPVPTMRRTSELGYAAGAGWQAVEIPYFGGRLAMRLVIPTGALTPADLLTPSVLAAAAQTAEREVDLHLPTWDFESAYDLRALLPKLGLTAPFGASADLSGITTAEQLAVDQARHKANITVDRYGTEAAAATVITGVPVSKKISPTPPLTVRADRPFAFTIVDTKTGAPLFLGSVADPRKK